MFGHASNPKIVDVIADLLGSQDIKVYGDQLFMKNPSVGSSIPCASVRGLSSVEFFSGPF